MPAFPPSPIHQKPGLHRTGLPKLYERASDRAAAAEGEECRAFAGLLQGTSATQVRAQAQAHVRRSTVISALFTQLAEAHAAHTSKRPIRSAECQA